MVLAVILGLGLVYVCSRVAVAQRYMNANSLAVQQIRYTLQTSCSGTPSIAIASASCVLGTTSGISASATTSSGTISISSIAVSTPTASASSSNLGGTITFTP